MWPVKYIYRHPSLSPSVIYPSSVFSRSLRYRIIRSMHGGDRASSFSVFLFQKLIEYLVPRGFRMYITMFCPGVVVLVLSESPEPSHLEHVRTKRCQCWSKFTLINHQGITWSFHSRIHFHKNKQAELQHNFHTKSHMTAHRRALSSPSSCAKRPHRLHCCSPCICLAGFSEVVWASNSPGSWTKGGRRMNCGQEVRNFCLTC